MEKNIIIPIDQKIIENFEEEAIQELVNNTTVYVTQMIEEANLLESTRRKGIGKPSVRQIDVKQAFLVPQLIKRKPLLKKVLHGLVVTLSFIPGFIYSNHTVLSDIVCLVIIIIVMLLTVYLMGD